jgi:hypothetical protein
MSPQEFEVNKSEADSRVGASALDNPLNATYVRVLVVETVIVILLIIIGRIFS